MNTNMNYYSLLLESEARQKNALRDGCHIQQDDVLSEHKVQRRKRLRGLRRETFCMD